MRESDAKKKDGIQAKNDAENLIYTVEKQMADLKEKISSGDEEDLKKKIAEVRTSLENSDADVEALQAKTKELQEASWKVTQQAYQNTSNSEDSEKEKKEEEAKK